MAFFAEEGQTFGYNKATFEKIGVKSEHRQKEQSFNQENMSIECEEENVPLIEEQSPRKKRRSKKIKPKEKLAKSKSIVHKIKIKEELLTEQQRWDEFVQYFVNQEEVKVEIKNEKITLANAILNIKEIIDS
jgi:hypothetical protein